jgi:hypothetical protein
MPRRFRIHLVIGLAVFLVGLLMVFGGGVAAMGSLDDSAHRTDHVDEAAAKDLLDTMRRTHQIGRTTFLVGGSLEAGSLLYLLVVQSAWFIRTLLDKK